jgi:streptogramin lyase
VRKTLMVLAGLCVLYFVPAALAAPTPEFYDLPSGYSAGTGIATAPDGSVWFVADPSTVNPSIGRLIPAQAAPETANGMATFPTPTQIGTGCCANAVRSVAFDAANNRVWFVQNDGIVGYANAAEVAPGTDAGMQDTLLSTQTSSGPYSPDLWDIAIGANGLAWFSEQSSYNVAPYPGDRIASIDAGLHVNELENLALQGGASTLSDQRYDAEPEGITTDSQGKPWFAEANAGLPGYRIATQNGQGYSEYQITPCAATPPCSGSNTGTGSTDVAVAPDGSIWFTNELKNQVGRLDPSAQTFTNYNLSDFDSSLAGGAPRAISVASDGTLWVAEDGSYSYPLANAIVRIVPTQPTPTALDWHLGVGKFPYGIAPDTHGNVWFALGTEQAPGLIGELPGVLGAGTTTEPPAGGNSNSGSSAAGGSTSTSSGSTALGAGTALAPASVGAAHVGNPAAHGSSVSVEQICLGPPSNPCAVVYLLSAGEYVTGFPGTTRALAAKSKKPKPVILGQKTVTLLGGQHRKVTVQLNAKGRKLLKRTGHLTVFFTATQAGAHGAPAKRIKASKVTFKAKRG